MSVNRTSSFAGAERRSGLERRAVAPRENATSPRMVGTVDVGGKSFGPGQEAAFMEAVEAHNKQAQKDNQPQVDLSLLESKGYIRNFGGKSAAAFSPATRSMQTERGSREPVEVENPGVLSGPGVQHLDEVAPVPPDLPEAGLPSPAGKETKVVAGGRATARRGGGGNLPKATKAARGERTASASRAREE